VTQYTFQITFNGDSDFVASVYRVKRPASSEALPHVISLLGLFLGCPVLIVFFISYCNLFFMYLKKEEKKKERKKSTLMEYLNVRR
jgi:flagellar biosynthesis component FlhA